MKNPGDEPLPAAERPHHAGQPAPTPSESLLLRTPLVLVSGVLASSVLATLAIVIAMLYSARLSQSLEQAEILHQRERLLHATLEPLLEADRVESAAWMHLLGGRPIENFERAKAELVQSLERTREIVTEAQNAEHSSDLARDVLLALDTFEAEHPELGGPFETVLATDRLWQTLGWIRISPPESEWFRLASVVFEAELAPAYAYDHLDNVLAMQWHAGPGRSLPPAVEDWLAVQVAENLRVAGEVEGRDEALERGVVRPLRDTLNQRRAAAVNPELGRLFSELDSLRGFQQMREDNALLFGLREAPQKAPEQLYAEATLLDFELTRMTESAQQILDRQLLLETARARRHRLLTAIAAAALALSALALLVWIEHHRRRLFLSLKRTAEIDQLTGLGNRHALRRTAERLSDTVGGTVSLLALDLDRFKAINDTYGHQTGDEALAVFAARCRGVLRPGDEMMRMGGDEFLVVLESRNDPEGAARAVAERIIGSLSTPVRCRDHQFVLEVSIGCATADLPLEIDDLLVEADLALHEAKQASADTFRYAVATVSGGVVRRLPEMLRQRQLECDFQPQVDLTTGEIVGLEALARWPTAAPQKVAPRTMVDAVEWLGLNRELVINMLSRVGAALQRLNASFAGRFWINLSPSDLANPRAAEELLELLREHGLPFDRIGVELTETLPVVDLEIARGAFERLRQHGVGVALDDFTTGSSTLQLLSRLPLDTIKLDRTVVGGIATDQASQVLTRAILDICQHHGVRCVAEGVESREDLDQLARIGVETVQGFVLARPLDLDQLEEFLATRSEETRPSPRTEPSGPLPFRRP
ncbi:MAG TPA: EAL domain-containing protein [Thermoanaerobaculia bacterium]|nr:EAL domain-containing protein [Thermoanaerobaculia bacterium]